MPEQLGIDGTLPRKPGRDGLRGQPQLARWRLRLIITVGFLLGDATQEAARPIPANFSIVDFAYDPVIPNVLGQVYATDQAAFLAGYLAAGMTETALSAPSAASTSRRSRSSWTALPGASITTMK
jgi:basic membrane protein A